MSKGGQLLVKPALQTEIYVGDHNDGCIDERGWIIVPSEIDDEGFVWLAEAPCTAAQKQRRKRQLQQLEHRKQIAERERSRSRSSRSFRLTETLTSILTASRNTIANQYGRAMNFISNIKNTRIRAALPQPADKECVQALPSLKISDHHKVSQPVCK
ncbi:hypothetical protein KI387_027825, partial [Taxus chinensis]